VGTQFAVRRYDGPPLVVVQEGTVEVKRTDSDENISVNAGERLEILRSGDLITRQANVKEELKWARKLVNFSGKTIGEVAQEFNRHNTLQIKIDDAKVASEVLSLADYFLDEPQSFVDSLEAQGKVTVQRIGAETLRLSSGPGG
jgi:ferric-dicitrate binding protein FerR (iron transport regulator)